MNCTYKKSCRFQRDNTCYVKNSLCQYFVPSSDDGVRSNDLIAGREPREQDGGAEGNQGVKSEATTRAIAAESEQLLLPCPFCSYELIEMALRDTPIPAHYWGAYCHNCSAWGPIHSNKKIAVDLWNTRAWHP